MIKKSLLDNLSNGTFSHNYNIKDQCQGYKGGEARKINNFKDIDVLLSSTRTRPDTRLPQSRAGGQGLYLRSLNHLERNSETKDRENPQKSKV